jgi:predicted nuclease with TOPRIM domain
VAVLWDEVRSVIEGVEAERLSPQQGNTMVRGYGTLIQLSRLDIEQAELDIARRRLELDEEERTELRTRLEELEQHLETKRDPWGA